MLHPVTQYNATNPTRRASIQPQCHHTLRAQNGRQHPTTRTQLRSRARQRGSLLVPAAVEQHGVCYEAQGVLRAAGSRVADQHALERDCVGEGGLFLLYLVWSACISCAVLFALHFIGGVSPLSG
jgi:hypothetical protein